jgi:hypothetical protein
MSLSGGGADAHSAAGPEVNKLTEHLSEAQIERYVTRRANVDELLEAAQHFDACFECRDRAAAFVDAGSGSISHTRRRRTSGPRPPVSERQGRRVLIGAIVVLLIVAVLLIWWLQR